MRRVQVLVFIFLLMLGPSTAQAKSFSDINGFWAEKEILRLTNLGLSDGYKGKFLPKNQVSRAEFAKMAVNALGLEAQAQIVAKTKSPFKDLPASHWGNGYIIIAYENNILTGYPDKTVRPDAPISRVEIAALMMRTLEVQQGKFYQSTTSTTPELNFQDAQTIPQWAVNSIAEAVQRGFISGYADNTFRPGNSADRAEAVVLVSRLLTQLGGQVDYQGTISKMDRIGHTLTLQMSGQSVDLELADDAVFYRDKAKVDWQAIEKDDDIGLILNKEGKISYLEVIYTIDDFASPFIRQNIKKQPASSGSAPAQAAHNTLEPSLLAEAAMPESATHPEKSLQLTRKEMNVDELVKTSGASGAGQIIAIVDTGVDPAHPDLMVTSSGKPKIVDWVDFTNEGKINTAAVAVIKSDTVTISGKNYRLPAGISKSGKLHYGYWEESKIENEYHSGTDLNGNKTLDDVFLVLVADHNKSGVYNSVVVDTDQDGDLKDESLINEYKVSKQTAKIPTPEENKYFGFVLTKMVESGSEVQLGFDSNGHGTHVAGIAAGSGQLTGVAPGAQLMVLKALYGTGTTDDWKNIAEAVNYAANHGAKIINLSLGIPEYAAAGDNGANKLLQILSDVHGVIFVVASGNSGPGINTLSTPADTDGVISVGAYITPAMWKQDFNWDIEQESLWYFSSIGPRFDGAMMPQIVAPGSVFSTYPRGGYKMEEGTSMASPHVAGAVALLLDNAQRNKIAYTPAKIRRALALGAKPMAGFTEIEQGYGKVDVAAAWQQLQKLSNQPEFIPEIYNIWFESGKGLLAREFLPGNLDVKLQSLANQDSWVTLQSNQPWMKPQQDKIIIPALSTRQFRMDYNVPTAPGLYVSRLIGQIEGVYGSAVEMINTVINPYLLDEENQYHLNFEQDIPAGQFKRYFVKVPEGAKNLHVAVSVEQGANKYLGRARVHLYNPFGVEIDVDPFDFAGEGTEERKATVEKNVADPGGGTWEVVVYSSASLSQHGLKKSNTALSIEAQPAGENNQAPEDSKLGFADSNYLVGVIEGASPKLTAGKAGGANTANSLSQPENVTFVVRLKENLQPYEGVMEINSRMYNVKKGRVTVRVKDLFPDTNNLEPLNWVISLPGA